MKILFLVPYPEGHAPSQRFRFEQYLDQLQENNYQVTIQSFWDQQSWSVLYLRGNRIKKIIGFVKGLTKRIKIVFGLHHFDLVFIHRECLPIGPPLFEWVISKIFRKRIIYDFDDAIWLPNTSDENKMVSFLKWHSKVKSISRWSHKISCGNSYLAEYAKQFNQSIFVNPTTIDTKSFHNPYLHQDRKKESIVTIGWTGTHSTLQFLEPLVPVIRKLEKEGRIRFVVISNKRPHFKTNTLEFIPWSLETEIANLLIFDIGIMPLIDNKWAKGKCGFKALQYMAMGIPAVASPVGINTSIIDHKVDGFLCENENDWLQTLSLLIQDEELRKLIGKKGRQKVIKSYSVESNTRNFLSLFS